MKFYCNGMELSNATNIVAKAIAVNKNIPILEGIKISAYGKTVVLSAFNQEIYIEKTILADIHEEGEAIVNGKMFNECANKISGIDNVCIEKNSENKISIKFGKSSLALNYYESAGFAVLGEYSDENSVKIKESDFKEFLERVIFCVSTGNENRMLLKSCSIEVKDGILESVCLDGFRLAISQKPVVEETGKLKCVVLGKIISDVIKILGDSDDVIKLIGEKKNLLIDLGHTKIRTTLVDSEFYNYKNNLLKGDAFEIIVNKRDFEESLNRAAIISRDTSSKGIIFTIEGNTIEINSENEKGNINEYVDCQYNGEKIRISLNYKFLLDAIARIKEDYLKILIEDNKKPIIVKRVDGDDYRCIILPIRLLA